MVVYRYFEPWDWIISVSSYREEFRELVNVEDFRDSILSLQFGQTGYSYIIDEQGRIEDRVVGYTTELGLRLRSL